MLRQWAVALGLSLMATFAVAAENASQWVYFGTRADGTGQGIVGAQLDTKTGTLTSLGRVAEVTRPSWLLAHPRLPVLYSVSDAPSPTPSSVLSYSVDPVTGALRELNRVNSGGSGATHLALDEASQSLFVAHFGSGQVSWLPLQPDAQLELPRALQSQYGTGPHRRQTSPHAHGVVVDPTHRWLLSADLGADRVFVYRFDPETKRLWAGDPAFVAVAPGSGPRHLVFHPNGRFVYLVTELSAQVICYQWQSGRLKPLQTRSLDAPDYQATKSASEIVVSRDGRFVYVGNRGQNLIVVYSTNAHTSELAEMQRISAQGEAPWSFAFDASERWLLVANHGSNSISVLERDSSTGKLSATAIRLEVARPSSVAFVRNLSPQTAN